MNVEIGTEAAQFPEKEYKNGIFVAVRKNRILLFLWSFGHLGWPMILNNIVLKFLLSFTLIINYKNNPQSHYPLVKIETIFVSCCLSHIPALICML
jgi:hypothetical protein